MDSIRRGAVTVVVVNWNRRRLLEACLASLERQRGADFEIIVVDNGSTDGSADLVESMAGANPEPRIRLIRNPANLGFAAANNLAVAQARTEYVALLNNDAEADPDWLASLIEAIETDTGFGMAASKVLVHEDPRYIDKVGHLIFPDGQNRGRGTGELDCGQYDRMEEVLWPDGCAALYRKELFDRLGGFDEDFFAYAEDADLGLRARIAGWRCVYAPRAVVYHHRAATLGVVSTRRVELIERNRVLLAVKLFPWSLLWLNGVYYLMRLSAGVLAAAAGKGEVSQFRGVRGKLRVAMALLRGDLQALPRIPAMLVKRWRFRSQRVLSPSQVRRLILDHRIGLRTLSERTAAPVAGPR